MICKVCGRTIANEDANFCEYCGASFREIKQVENMSPIHSNSVSVNGEVQGEQTYQQNQPVWQGQSYQQAQASQQMAQSMLNSQQEKPISFLNWLGTMLLPYIPFFGGITYMVMLFIWAFSKDSNPTKKNWARAKLVVTVISMISMILLIAYLAESVLSSGMTFKDYVNTTYY